MLGPFNLTDSVILGISVIKIHAISGLHKEKWENYNSAPWSSEERLYHLQGRIKYLVMLALLEMHYKIPRTCSQKCPVKAVTPMIVEGFQPRQAWKQPAQLGSCYTN